MKIKKKYLKLFKKIKKPVNNYFKIDRFKVYLKNNIFLCFVKKKNNHQILKNKKYI